MKQRHIHSIIACAMLLAGNSCKKAYDYIRQHPDDRISFCRIMQIRTPGGFDGGMPDTFDVTYNAKGDPTDIVERPRSYFFIDNWDQHFRYDKAGRLIYYFINFNLPAGTPIGGTLTFHKYAYPRPNFVTDTIINYSDGIPPNYKDYIGEAYIKGYLLDNKGKIIKLYDISADPHQPPQFVADVTYDNNGNLSVPDPAVTYDNMVNPYRTNYAFQFAFNDFSRNNQISVGPNPFGVSPVYNQFGLPVVIPFPRTQPLSLLFGVYTGSLYFIDYACTTPKGPIEY